MVGAVSPLGFNDLMTLGDAAHNEERYTEALRFAAKAYTVADPDSLDQGRAARGVSARYVRLGDEDEANRIVAEVTDSSLADDLIAEALGDEAEGRLHNFPTTAKGWLSESLRIHDAVVRDEPRNPWALRERGLGRMYLGVFVAREFITRIQGGGKVSRKEGLEVTVHLDAALADTKKATSMRHDSGELKGKMLDQYTINTIGRTALAHGLFGVPGHGFSLADDALRVSRFSESPKIDTSSGTFTDEQRHNAVSKARKRAYVALFTSAAAMVMPRNAHNPIWRKAILPLAERAL